MKILKFFGFKKKEVPAATQPLSVEKEEVVVPQKEVRIAVEDNYEVVVMLNKNDSIDKIVLINTETNITQLLWFIAGNVSEEKSDAFTRFHSIDREGDLVLINLQDNMGVIYSSIVTLHRFKVGGTTIVKAFTEDGVVFENEVGATIKVFTNPKIRSYEGKKLLLMKDELYDLVTIFKEPINGEKLFADIDISVDGEKILCYIPNKESRTGYSPLIVNSYCDDEVHVKEYASVFREVEDHRIVEMDGKFTFIDPNFDEISEFKWINLTEVRNGIFIGQLNTTKRFYHYSIEDPEKYLNRTGGYLEPYEFLYGYAFVVFTKKKSKEFAFIDYNDNRISDIHNDEKFITELATAIEVQLQPGLDETQLNSIIEGSVSGLFQSYITNAAKTIDNEKDQEKLRTYITGVFKNVNDAVTKEVISLYKDK